MSEMGMPMPPPMPGGPMPGPPMGMPPPPMGGPPMGGMPPPMPAPPPVPEPVHDVTVSRTRKYSCAKVENIPPEEFGVTRRQRSVMMRDCDYCYHERRRTQASLIADGYDEEQVKALPNYSSDVSEESLARDTVDDSSSDGQDAVNRATREILTVEHYILLDYEGKGKPQRYRITTGGNDCQILKHEGKAAIEPDIVRFAAMTPYIMTHRFFGRSVADLVMEIQKIKTALTRALLDNAYGANNNRYEVAESHATKDTLDDLLSNRIGGLIRTKAPGGVIPMINQPIGNFVFPLLEYFDQRAESRTGVSKQGQGLDPQALQNIGEKAVMDAADAAKAKTKLIARIFAETGIKEMFWLLHRTVRENATEADTVKLKNKWIPVDPREWRQRDDLNVNVGLGGGSREFELQFLTTILGYQIKTMTETPELKLAKPENAYATMKQLIRKGGLKSIEPFFTNPAEEPDPEPTPTPEEQKLQADMEMKKQQLQFDQAKAQKDGEMEMQRMQQEMALKREQMQAELALKREQLGAELQLQQQQFMAELAMKERVGMAGAAMKGMNNGGGTSGVHIGGEPG